MNAIDDGNHASDASLRRDQTFQNVYGATFLTGLTGQLRQTP
jgi:hypothetical protein